jgi:hypothetical protein
MQMRRCASTKTLEDKPHVGSRNSNAAIGHLDGSAVSVIGVGSFDAHQHFATAGTVLDRVRDQIIEHAS